MLRNENRNIYESPTNPKTRNTKIRTKSYDRWLCINGSFIGIRSGQRSYAGRAFSEMYRLLSGGGGS